MDESSVRSDGSDRAVERGETYDHAEHGRVEVTGIWRGVESIDSSQNTTETDTVVVRYSKVGEPISELTDTMDEFFEAVGRGDQ